MFSFVVGLLPRVCAVCEGTCRMESQTFSHWGVGGAVGGENLRGWFFMTQGQVLTRSRAHCAGGLGHAPRQAGRVVMPEGDTDYVDEASDAAATKVQAILRGSKARKTVTKSVACHEECIDSDAVFDAAATKVQAILRGSKARKSDAGVEVRLRALARASYPPPRSGLWPCRRRLSSPTNLPITLPRCETLTRNRTSVGWSRRPGWCTRPRASSTT